MIPLSKPCIGIDELDAIQDVMCTGCLAGTCEEVTKFEEEFARYVGAKYAVATSSCTTALHLACLVMNLSWKSRVIVPAFTFPATAFAPMYTGARVDLVDVDPETYNINMDTALSGPHDVVIPVHAFGNPADLDAVHDHCADTGAQIIEDAACCPPAKYHGHHAGTIGIIGCYSFYAIKSMCTGEGGMLVTDDEDLAARARSLCDFGKTTLDNLPIFTNLGYNYRLSAIQAAMGRVQLKKLNMMHESRKVIADFYTKNFKELSTEVKPQTVEGPGCEPSYQRYVVTLSEDIDRDAVIRMMKDKCIQTAIGTFDLSSQPVFFHQPEKPVSKFLGKQTLSLPLYADMTIKDAEKVINTLLSNLVYCEK